MANMTDLVLRLVWICGVCIQGLWQLLEILIVFIFVSLSFLENEGIYSVHCPNREALSIIRDTSDSFGVQSSAFNETLTLQKELNENLDGNWGVLILKNEHAPGKLAFWAIPGDDYCNIAYRGWYYAVWRVDVTKEIDNDVYDQNYDQFLL